MNHIDNIDIRTKEYFQVLEPNFPEWLIEYINTPELLKQQYISITCGTIYSDLFESDYFFSSLDHSVAVALICWHFTNDKKVTLAGLFHDIATPTFKHCIDFLNGDYMNQESTEDLTTKIIKSSKEIKSLLKRDNIALEEVNDYHIYSIADNDTPRLSSDRLEYSLSNALLTYNLLDLTSIKEIYDDIEIQKNEEGIVELGFKTIKIANKFVEVTSKLSVIYREDRTRYSMQLLADIIKKLNEEKIITIKDLYDKNESEIIDVIENSQYKEIFDDWKNAKAVKISKERPLNVYFVHHGAKVRYIDPLVNDKRISEIDDKSKQMIEKNLSYDMSNYVYLDFNF
ncbi:MAG: HD domain-containing protein [Clostridium sp.]|nr:HD domain-containing protein [Clostridium sp.]MCM1443910.1 HD domain-containing protein [Candidatus Amulumruptor caecigallinarius]